MIALWVALMVAGLAISGVASGKALRSAESLGQLAGLSPFVIGLTILSVGTDLPEIANSLTAAVAGRGDLNVGDSTGSAATQLTFVLGLLLLMRPMTTQRVFVATTGAFTVIALVVGAALMMDGEISRLDGGLLVCAWVGSTFVVARTSRLDRTSQPSLFGSGALRELRRTLVALAAVGGGAVAAVTAFGQITDELGVPEYATSFFILSVGTSLPELLVDGRAIRSGSASLALGDLLGSSLVDSTLSLGVGPLAVPTDVSTEAAYGTLIVSAVVAGAIIFLLTRTRHSWPSGLVLIGLYAALFPLLIVQ
jgi:cation:H+ antiporter